MKNAYDFGQLSSVISNYVNCVTNFYRPQTKFVKVMFLHLSVILFTGKKVSARVVWVPGVSLWGDLCPGEGSLSWGGVSVRGSLSWRPPRTVTRGGTRPTGMHSCTGVILKCVM